MHYFTYKDSELFCENVPIRSICDTVGTPVYIYSLATLERHFKVFQEPFASLDHLICYSMKANSNLAILRIFRDLGGGADIVSGGELYRALKAGIDPAKIVYSGVGKKASEIDEALNAGILMFNVESEEELLLLDQRAQALGRRAPVALRVNPDVDPLTHPYISTGLKRNKFGIDTERSIELYRKARQLKGIEFVGVDCHIGSQLTELSPFLEAVDLVQQIVQTLRADGVDVRNLDIGGGLGIPYEEDEEPPLPSVYGSAIAERVGNLQVKLILEPGRLLVGNAGILCTKVLYQKKGPQNHFVIVDAAMNDLVRPSLYKAHHAIWKVVKDTNGGQGEVLTADVVGPICESGDFLAQSREMPPVKTDDLLAVMSAGAYGFSMASNYNSRPRVAEVLVSGNEFHVIRARETYEDLVRGEHIPSGMLQST